MADVKYLIEVDATGAVKSVKEFDAAMDKLPGQAGKVGTGVSGMWKQFALGQFVVNATTKLLRGLEDQLAACITQAAGQEKADKALESALSSTGRTVQGNLQHYIAFASAQQKLTTYTDDEIEATQAFLLTLGTLDQKGMDAATKGAMGLATTMGVDLHTATMTVGKAMEGQYTALGRVGIKVSETMTAEEKHAYILERLGALYQRSTAETGTFEGGLKQLKNSWGEVQETVGMAIVKNESVQRGIKDLNEWVTKLAGNDDFKLWLSTVVDGLIAAAKAVGVFAKGCKDLMDKVFGATKANKEYQESTKLLEAAQVRAAAAGHTNIQRVKDLLAAVTKAIPVINEKGTRTKTATAEDIKAAEAQKKLGESAQALIQKYMPLVGQMSKLKEEEALLNKARAAGAISAKDYDIAIAANTKAFRDVGVEAGAAAKAFGVAQKAGQDIIAQGFTPLQTAMARAIADEKTLSAAFGDGKDPAAYAKGLKVIQKELDKADDEAKKLARTQKKDLADSFKSVVAAANPLRAAILAAIEQERLYDNAMKAGFITKNEYIKLMKAMAKELKDPGPMATWVKNNQAGLNKVFEMSKTVIDGISAMHQQSTNNKLALMDQEYQARLLNIQNSLMSETEKNSAISALDAEYDVKRKGLLREAAEQGKKVAIANAIISTAEGMAKALSQVGIYGIILAAVVAAFGAIQIARIRAQPIPLNRGAIFDHPVFSPSGDYVAGEKRPEAIIPLEEMPRMIREITGGRGSKSGSIVNVTVSLSIGAEKIDERMFRVANDRVEWLHSQYKHSNRLIPLRTIGGP